MKKGLKANLKRFTNNNLSFQKPIPQETSNMPLEMLEAFCRCPASVMNYRNSFNISNFHSCLPRPQPNVPNDGGGSASLAQHPDQRIFVINATPAAWIAELIYLWFNANSIWIVGTPSAQRSHVVGPPAPMAKSHDVINSAILSTPDKTWVGILLTHTQKTVYRLCMRKLWGKKRLSDWFYWRRVPESNWCTRICNGMLACKKLF